MRLQQTKKLILSKETIKDKKKEKEKGCNK